MFRSLYQLILVIFSPDRNFYSRLRSITGFLPRRLSLYKIAFVHKSVNLVLKKGLPQNNERLEFLGDAILDAIIAEYIYAMFPDRDEGFLTQLRSKIVKRKQLNKIAFQMGLSALILTRTRTSETRRNILGNTLEAFIGAIYLDRGFSKTKTFVIEQVLKKHIDLQKLARKESDFKSRIIEWAQKNKQPINFSSQEETSKESRDPHFIAQVFHQDKELGSGFGRSKKDAEQQAAQKALAQIAKAN